MRLHSDATLARMRRTDEDNMPDTAVLTRKGAFVPTGGGTGYYDDDVVTTYPCRRAPMGTTETERMVASQLQNIELESVHFPVDAVIFQDDEPLINGVRYTVVALVPLASYSVRRVAICRKEVPSG